MLHVWQRVRHLELSQKGHICMQLRPLSYAVSGWTFQCASLWYHSHFITAHERPCYLFVLQNLHRPPPKSFHLPPSLAVPTPAYSWLVLWWCCVCEVALTLSVPLNLLLCIWSCKPWEKGCRANFWVVVRIGSKQQGWFVIGQISSKCRELVLQLNGC